MRIFLTDKNALAYFERKASPEYWDEHWDIDNLRERILGALPDDIFCPAVKKYLPNGGVILEGGCGQGWLVQALTNLGYQAIGLDFARRTVEKVKAAAPHLDIRHGDVRKMDIRDGSLDGYISAGVIEHFWDGYQPILEEMQRTIRPGGFLFVSFPFMSGLRKFKKKWDLYETALSSETACLEPQFYQYALDWRDVRRDLENLGFDFLEAIKKDGVKGLKDEVPFVKPYLQKVYDGRMHRRLLRYYLKILTPLTPHSIMMVMQKNKGNPRMKDQKDKAEM